MAEIFGPDVPIVFVLALAMVGLPIWAVLDVLSRPAVAFYDAESHRGAWIGVLLVSFVFGLGALFAAYYLIGVRPKVRRQSHMVQSR